ncbi:Trk family potassium uptake protein [Ligilactobacillus equi]|uniref:TrkH family potassium uptake protein n=1 Tax=Ligilactobacillus equi TaxID=137357 RepID=UPI002ED2A3AB
MLEIGKWKISFPKFLTGGFIVIALIGTTLLMLPIATTSGKSAGFMTAFFTATSATCVTGLAIVNPATYWSLFGQTVLLFLIEIGGLGFMSFAVLGFMLARQRIGVSTKLLTQESLSLKSASQFDVVYLVLRMSFLIQLMGVLLLLIDFWPRYGFAKGLWFSIFHAVSAFCNAGIDLFGNSLQDFATDTYLLVVFALLILAGSFGFLVTKDLLAYPRKKKLSLHTRLSLTTGLVLFGVSVLTYFITENNLAQFADHLDFKDRIFNTIFMAITPRTAGLVALPYNNISAAGLSFTAILMFIGGTPGSTAGGIKTTTVGLLAMQSIATLRGKTETTFAHRRFTMENINRALTLIFVSLTLMFLAVLILTKTQTLPEHDQLQLVVFEVMAAFGTSGISLGITENLNVLGQAIIMFLMFIGRVGLYTVMYSIFNAKPQQKTYHYPEEEIMIG